MVWQRLAVPSKPACAGSTSKKADCFGHPAYALARTSISWTHAALVLSRESSAARKASGYPNVVFLEQVRCRCRAMKRSTRTDYDRPRVSMDREQGETLPFGETGAIQ